MNAEDAAWRRLRHAASAPYRAAGRYAWHFARGKLAGDPVFRQLLARGFIGRGARVVDIGCGQGLLASLLRAVDGMPDAWPDAWGDAPAGARVTGIELTARDIARARAALGPGATFIHGDMRRVPLPPCDLVVMLDVLHYIAPVEQDLLLARVAAALVPSGRLLLRVGDAAEPRGFAFARRVDAVVARLRGYRVAPASGRSIDAWTTMLTRLGFAVVAHPMSQGTPFANVLLECARVA